VNHIGMLLLMGVPIVLSGRDNLFEQFGHGTGQVWDSWWDVLVGRLVRMGPVVGRHSPLDQFSALGLGLA